MKNIERITLNQQRMGGRPCIRNTRVTAGTIVGLIASGFSTAEILKKYTYLEDGDIKAALEYAAWRSEEVEISLAI